MSSTKEISNSRDTVVFAAASGLGLIAGMRSVMAPTVVAFLAESGCSGTARKDFGLLGQPMVKRLLIGMAGAEVLFDKLPFMPKRTQWGALAGRILMGAWAGATVCGAMRRSRFIGAFAGTLGAIGATYASYQVRAQVVEALGIPDSLVAGAEDLTAMWTGRLICNGLSLAGREAQPASSQVHSVP